MTIGGAICTMPVMQNQIPRCPTQRAFRRLFLVRSIGIVIVMACSLNLFESPSRSQKLWRI